MDNPHDSNAELNQRITEFGRRIFTAIGEEQPSTFNRNYLPGRLMQWAMTKHDFKVDLFRLVDVLPTLHSNNAVAQHVTEYLSESAADIHGLMGWGTRVSARSLRGKMTAVAVRQSVRQMAKMFIAGEGPEDSAKALQRLLEQGLAFTVDLLGEYCVSEPEAEAYMQRYLDALQVLSQAASSWKSTQPAVQDHPTGSNTVNVSIKLTALYSQCSPLNFTRSVDILSERLARIVRMAADSNAMVCVDAEDSGSNPIIYEAYKRVFGSEEFKEFPYPGIVVQSYLKNADEIVQDLLDFARTRGNPISIRLVKGAYWDYETVIASQHHWPSPLFSNKSSTDATYERLTRTLLDNHQDCLPAFGSHNVRSLSYACCYAADKGLTAKDFEIQTLYGMAEPIAKAFAKQGYFVRLYVPLGQMLPGMGYLVRRLLENTSNESFLKHTFFDEGDVDQLLQEPVMQQELQ